MIAILPVGGGAAVRLARRNGFAQGEVLGQVALRPYRLGCARRPAMPARKLARAISILSWLQTVLGKHGLKGQQRPNFLIALIHAIRLVRAARGQSQPC